MTDYLIQTAAILPSVAQHLWVWLATLAFLPIWLAVTATMKLTFVMLGWATVLSFIHVLRYR